MPRLAKMLKSQNGKMLDAIDRSDLLSGEPSSDNASQGPSLLIRDSREGLDYDDSTVLIKRRLSSRRADSKTDSNYPNSDEMVVPEEL
jgi:hypothetical protein